MLLNVFFRKRVIRMEPKIHCICGHDKIHTQVCWLKTEVEIPQVAESSACWTADVYSKHVPICKRCLLYMLQERKTRGDNVSGGSGESLLWELLLKKKSIDAFFPESQEQEEGIVDAALEVLKNFETRYGNNLSTAIADN